MTVTERRPLALPGDDLQQCIHCGMCLEACPTYRITGLETESPRGRIHIMSGLASGAIATDDDAARLHLDRCLACRACEAVCPSGVPYGRLIELARGGLAEGDRAGGRSSRLERLLLRGLVSHPRRLALLASVLSLYERTGLRALARRTGALRLLPARLRRLEAYAPPLARPRYRPVRAPARVRARVALLLGCVMRVAYGDVHTAAARVLARYGVAVVEVPAQTCCGALHAHAGDLDEARRLARANIEAFERAEVDAVVVDAAGCGAHLKGYADLFAYGDTVDPAWAERAARLAARVRDVTEYLAEAIEAPVIGRLPLRVTYQDPCHLAHAQGVRSQPRALLRKVEGLELVEMADADVCCGSAGSYNITQPAYADRLLSDKLDAALATGAAAIVSANPGCMIQIAAGLRARGREVPVLHVVEVLDRALRS